MTERSSGTRYSRKNSGGTPPSKPYPLCQQHPDRGSEASKCRPTKLIPPPSVSNSQTEEAKLPSVVRQSEFSLPRQRPADRGSKASKCRPSSTHPQKKFTPPIPKERRTSNDNNKIQRQTHPNPYINHNHHLPHHPQLQPNSCSSRTQRGHNPERVLPNHNPVT